MFAPGFLYCKDEAVGQGGVVLQVRDVTRRSKGRLNHISFDVHKGEMVAVIGGSGAGKSTLLNAISGAVKPHGGHVWYNGLDLFLHHGALKSQIGFVPQKDIMHKGITLGSMLNYAARLRLQDDVSPAERQARVHQVMQELILREKGWLVVMLLCAPVVMLFVSFVCNEETFVTYSDTYKAMFTTICVPVFVGLLTANGEVCKERDVLYREYSANLRLGSYLVSKLVALFLLNLAQTALLTASFCVLVQQPPRALIFSPVTEMALTLFLTMYSSTCLGLLVSTVSSSRNMATQLLAVLLVPQIVLSGCVFDLEGLTRTLAQFIHAFWGTNALCVSAGVANLDMAETVIEKGMQAGMTFTADTPEKDYLLVSRENLLAAWRALGLLAAGCVALCYGALRLTADKFKG